MALRDLHLLGSPLLRRRSDEVAQAGAAVQQLVDDLFETMDAANGIGLAANQVGELLRIAVVDADGQRFAMVNPVIRESGGRNRAEEGCLSIPDLYAEVTRPDRVVLDAIDREGAPFTVEAVGLLARAIQHEIDHLDGILFVDHLSPLKRQLLLGKWKKEHRGDPTTKSLRPAEAGR